MAVRGGAVSKWGPPNVWNTVCHVGSFGLDSVLVTEFWITVVRAGSNIANNYSGPPDRRPSWSNLRHHPDACLGGLTKPTNNRIQDSRGTAECRTIHPRNTDQRRC